MQSDFSDLLSTFNDHSVEYLVVGAHALAAHGLIRATRHLDVLVRPSAENAPRVMAAWRSRVTACLGDVEVPVLSRHHLIVNKTKTGRKQDLADVEWLEQNPGEDEGA